MSMWRPAPQIKVKALGLHWRDGRLLAAEVHDDQGRVKGVRPLGGSVEFGERAEAAVKREFKEELGVDVMIVGAPIVMENLYDHEGAAGHEVLFIFEVAFPAEVFAGQERIHFHEDNGVAGIAGWYALDALDAETGPALYPSGLKRWLVDATRT